MSSELMTVSYSIRNDQDERLKREAKTQDLNASQIVRRILDEYFANLDYAAAKQARKAEQVAA